MIPHSLHHLLLVYLAYLVAVASPGPSTLSIMGVAMNRGRIPAIALALGVVTGIMVWATLAATGISAVLSAYAQAIFAIKIAGGAYLLFLSWRSLRAACAAEAPRGKTISGATNRAFYRQGVLIHLTNPKAVLGWIAMMSLGIEPGAPAYTLPAIVIGCVCLGLIVNVGYAFVFSTAAMGRAYRAARRWIEGTLAAVFGYAGLRLLLSRP